MILAVVGSRKLKDNKEAQKVIEDYIDRFNPEMIVSGGAIGIDSMAEKIAREKNKMVEVFYPENEDAPKPAAYFMRNTKIAMRADHVLAIMIPGGSAGTKDTVSKAMRLGKPVTIHIIESKIETDTVKDN